MQAKNFLTKKKI